MKPQRDVPGTGAEPAVESDALRMSDLTNHDSPEMSEAHEKEPFGHDWNDETPTARGGKRRIIIAAVAVGVVAAAVIGVKMAYDRRQSNRVYREAVAHLEDARDALISVASELPERSREVLQRVTNR